MALVTTKKMFAMAYKHGYAVGAFNVNNMEITQGIMSAAAEERRPLILQISQGARKYASMSYLRAIIDAAVEENPDIPICMHLDHGDTFETCKQCVDDGFTSVMIDGSHHPFEENITLTKQVVEYAHAHGVSSKPNWASSAASKRTWSGSSADDLSKHLTDPDQAADFWPDRRGFAGGRHRHQPRGLQVQNGTEAGVRRVEQIRRPAGLAAGDARLEQRAEGIHRPDQQVRRQDAQRQGRAGRGDQQSGAKMASAR